MPPLVIDNVVGGYGGAPVLNGLSLTVGERERVGLFGPNGHGKTTLLRAVSGLLALKGGSIRLFDKPIDGKTAASIVADGLIHVPQSNLLFPDMEVLETLLLGAQSPRARQNWARCPADWPAVAQRRRLSQRLASFRLRSMNFNT